MKPSITRRRFLGAAALALPALSSGSLMAQDSREALGPKQGKAKGGPHPLQAIMQAHPAALRADLRGVHPRVFITSAGLADLKQRATTTHKDEWQKALAGLVAMQQEPAAAPAQKRRAQNTTAIGIAGAAMAYRIEGDERYLAAARRYMEAAVSYPVWGYTFSKPNVDLAAGHLLYGLGMGYDLLFDVLTEDERRRYREKLAHQARLLAAHFAPKPGKTFSYSQNHCFIPIAGLAIAAYAIWDEEPEAAAWAAQSRAIFSRVLDVASPDGYFYEGVEYWVFSMPWIIHALDAFAHAAGDDLYDHPALQKAHLYMAHSLTPNGQDIFDFGDAFEGPLTRSRHGDEAARTHPNGKLHSNYNLLYRLAARYKGSPESAEAQGVADWMKSLGHVCAEDFWTLQWRDPSITAAPITALAPHHHFDDLGTVYWRSDWTDKATAFAFRAGPPEGHHAATLFDQLPDWHLSMGHSHPDAGSFILYANGTYLSGPMGYAGIPRSNLSNTVLIDGQGQANEGHGHDAFADYPYTRLDSIRLTTVKLAADRAEIVADLTGAFRQELGVDKLERRFTWEGGAWTTTDTLRASRPVVLTAQVHGDTTIAANGRQRYLVAGKPAALQVDVKTASAKAVIEKGVVTAAGPPGNVDKGPREERGAVLRISTPAARETSLVTTMRPARG